MQVSTAFEQALARANGTEVVSTDSHDLSDGSDAKLVTVRTSSGGKTYSAPVHGFKNKTGPLRVQCYERLTNKFYYFVIPYWSYCDMSGKSTIEIPFELDGTPRRVCKGKKKWANWWDFEVKSFKKLATEPAKARPLPYLFFTNPLDLSTFKPHNISYIPRCVSV